MAKPPFPVVINVTADTFEKEVVQRSQTVPVVVDFWARWCGPCQALGPLLEDLADDYEGKFVLAKVDIDKEQALAQKFRVSSIPLVLGIVEGEAIDYFTGALPESALKLFIDRLIPSPAKLRMKEAQDKETTAPVESIKIYQEIVEAEPKNTLARAALADLLLAASRPAEARTALEHVVEGVDGWERAKGVLARLEFQELASKLGTLADLTAQAATKDSRARYNLGLALAAQGKWEEALETWMQTLEADASFKDDVKTRMVQVFGILGQSHELTRVYRPRLASALY